MKLDPKAVSTCSTAGDVTTDALTAAPKDASIAEDNLPPFCCIRGYKVSISSLFDFFWDQLTYYKI